MTDAGAHGANEDREWRSSDLPRHEALGQWRQWAASTIAPVDVTVFDPDDFAARWISRGLGQLRVLLIDAPPQRVSHIGRAGQAMRAKPTIQLIYVLRGRINVAIGGRRFPLEPGQFVLFDNALFYQMEMDAPNLALDVMMPQFWLNRYVPDPGLLLGRAIDGRAGWGAPLGALLQCLGQGLEQGALPRTLLAEHVGSLLALATDAAGAGDGVIQPRHRARLVREILSAIEQAHADPALDAETVAKRTGISRSYMQVLLREIGTGFVAELTAIRLERAAAILADPKLRGLSIGEVAYRVGLLDPGYFARLFRKRFGMTPGDWRSPPVHHPAGQTDVQKSHPSSAPLLSAPADPL